MDKDSILNKFFEHLIYERNLSEHSVRAYKIDILAFFDWLQRNNLDFAKCSHKKLRLYLLELNKAQYKSKTIARKLSCIKTFYSYLLSIGAVNVNPAKLLSSPKIASTLPRVLTKEELTRIFSLFENIKDDDYLLMRDSAIIELFYACGCRISEIENLEIHMLDFYRKQVKLFGKGKKERIVPLHDTACAKLQQYLNKARPHLAARPSNALFLSKRGNALSSDAIRNIFKECCRRAGLDEHLKPHDLRHTFASTMIEGGADLRSVQEMLGHSSLETTQIYTHINPGFMKDVHKNAHPRA